MFYDNCNSLVFLQATQSETVIADQPDITSFVIQNKPLQT
jgi:hypothetical protein